LGNEDSICFTRSIQHPEMILPISKQRLCFHKIFAIVSSNVSIAAAMGGLLWQIWQSDWNFSQDSPRKSGAPAASRSRAEFIVATVEIVKQITRIENSSPSLDECNGLVGADWGIDQRGSSSRFPLSG